jgi:hypothetical protein
MEKKENGTEEMYQVQLPDIERSKFDSQVSSFLVSLPGHVTPLYGRVDGAFPNIKFSRIPRFYMLDLEILSTY